MSSYTVFAVYEDNLQPYSAIVEAGNPEAAIRVAQLQCLEDNGSTYASDDYPHYGACTLVGFQVVAGEVEVLPVDDMPFDIGTRVRWNDSEPWVIKAFATNEDELRAYIECGSAVRKVSTASLTPIGE